MTHMIDYVVRTVAVASDGIVPDCRPAPDIAVSPDAPRLEMLSLESFRTANASLQVFERQGPTQTFSVVVYAQDDQEVPYSWSVPVRLADLENNLKEYLENHKESTLYYREMGRLIYEHFFHAEDDREQEEQAAKAFAALQKLAERPKGQRTLFVRFANTASQLVFTPIQLLALDRDRARPLGVEVDVIQPLPPPLDLKASDDNSCVNSLNFVISPDVAKTLSAKPALDHIKTGLGFHVIDVWDEFVKYVGPQAQQESEALLLMAHHGPNRIAFSPTQPQAAVTSQTILRRFRPVSFAVLAACAVANISGDNNGRQILTRLNERGVGAAIVSPFGVPYEVGARLIAGFAEGASEARKSVEVVTVEALFRQAIANVTKDEKNLGDLDRFRVNEFMLVGNGAIGICKGGL